MFQSLKNRITGISDSLEMIKNSSSNLNNISMQTKIISINASIESAHAGQYGKTFSVVATEIKDLAERSEKIVEANQASQSSIVNDILTFEKEIDGIKEKIDCILQ
jgi:methyl-accepting chemotaxis protein